MRYQLDPPLLPRNGQVLKVLGVARISTINQDMQSLVDQEALHRQWVSGNYGGTAEFKMFASWRHQKYNEDTSRRIKQRLNNRFEKDGAVFQCEIYGYIKPPGCTSDLQVEKDPQATAVYDKWFSLLEGGASFAEVADWLNDQQIPLGPYARSKKWTGKMVGRLTYNPILKGQRERNRRHTVKHHGSGHRRATKAPPEMLKTRMCPHLAHIEPDRYDRVISLISRRNDIW
jgi:site-specific DNA recombinase